jgi:hypothetical protein
MKYPAEKDCCGMLYICKISYKIFTGIQVLLRNLTGCNVCTAEGEINELSVHREWLRNAKVVGG